MGDYYNILGVQKTASEKELKKGLSKAIAENGILIKTRLKEPRINFKR